MSKRDIIDRLDTSRSTATRAVTSLEEAGLVERTNEGYRTTTTGRLALRHHQSYVDGAGDIAAAADVIEPVPIDSEIDRDIVLGAETYLSSEPTPYRPVERLHDTITAATRYRGVLPALDDPRHVRLLYEHAVTDGHDAELIVTPELFESLSEEHSQQLDALRGSESFSIAVGETYRFMLLITDGLSGTTVSVLVFTERGAVHGLIQNTEEAAIRWGQHRYEAARENAVRVDEGNGSLVDGGRLTGPSLPSNEPEASASIKRQGFDRVDLTFFADRPVSDPLTAWRAGLGLEDVRAGYAIDRTRDVDGDERNLTEELISRLEAGTDCVVTGPPGSGKSVACKQVACAWYESDRGPVFYRASGQSQSFDAVDELLETLAATEGHALVVVEDAVRTEARGIFDVIEAVGDRDESTSISFLLDARTEEWQDAEFDTATDPRASIERIRMPRLLGRDCDRLVDRFETTTGVQLPTEEIVTTVREEFENGPGESSDGEVFFLLHQLSLAADRTDGRVASSMVTEVEQVYDELAEAGETALAVGAFVNLLNAAGIGIYPEYIHTLVPPLDGVHYNSDDGPLPADSDTIASVLDTLRDRVLFGRGPDGAYRTVHETWSSTFLSVYADRAPAPAATLGDACTRLLSTADEPGFRERIRRTTPGDCSRLDEIEKRVTEWADETARRLFELGTRTPKLAPLYGSIDGDGVSFPDACSPSVPVQCQADLAMMWAEYAEYDRASEEYETLRRRAKTTDGLDMPESFVAQSYRGLGKIDEQQGRLEEAKDRYETAIAIARETDDRWEIGRNQLRLGRVARLKGDLDTAETRYEAALDVFREIDDRRELAAALTELGHVERARSNLEFAEQRYERALEIHREVSDDVVIARVLGSLGHVAYDRGDLDEAEARYRQSLRLKRKAGGRSDVAISLHSLGNVARERGEFDTARDLLEEALELYRQLDRSIHVGGALNSLGGVAHQAGDLDAAEEYIREALEIQRDVGDTYEIALNTAALGEIRLEQGALNDAQDLLERGHELFSELQNRSGQADVKRCLGRLALKRGQYDTAERHARESLEIRRDIGERRGVGETRVLLGEIASRRGDRQTAIDHFSEVAELYMDLSMPRDAVDAILEVAEVASTRGDHKTALEWCETGQRIAAENGLDDAYGRLEEIRAGLSVPDIE